MHDTIEKEPVQKIEEEIKRCKRWVKLIFLKDGQSGFGVRVFNSEEECLATENELINSKGEIVSAQGLHPLTICRIYSKPCRQGREIIYPLIARSHVIPIPLKDE